MTIAVGDVLHLYFTAIHRPDYKYCIVIQTVPKFSCVLINSELTNYAKSNPAVFNAHAPIYAAECAPLIRDSWIGCADHFGQDIEKVQQAIEDRPDFHYGRISHEVAQRIVNSMLEAHTLSPRKKKLATEQLIATYGLPDIF